MRQLLMSARAVCLALALATAAHAQAVAFVRSLTELNEPVDVATPSGFEASEYDAIRRQAVSYILELRGWEATASATGE